MTESHASGGGNEAPGEGGLARYFVEHRELGWLALGVVLVWGGIALTRLSQQEDPTIPDRTAVVVTAFPGGRFYLVRLQDGGFLALSSTCTHLECSVPWSEKERKFPCPCHGSVFDITGQVLSPPAPRALDLFPVSIEATRILSSANP